MKRIADYQHKMILLFNTRISESKPDEYDYETYRLDYIHGISRGDYTIEPSIAYAYRDQDDFIGDPREEDTFEYGLNFKRKFEKINTELSLGYKHIRTVSTRTISSYEDNRISGGVMFVSSCMKAFKINFISILLLASTSSLFAQSLEVIELEGEVNLDRPGQVKAKFEKDMGFSEWDRISLSEKSKLKLKYQDDVTLEFSKNSLMQFVKCRYGKKLILRLLKGRVRIENMSKNEIEMQTLNSVLRVPFGKTDVIISAMNTLVAPREGKDVKVGTLEKLFVSKNWILWTGYGRWHLY